MATENLPKKRRVWQDIRPVKQQPRPTAEIKPIEKLPRKRLRLPTIPKKVFIIFLIISVILGLSVTIFWYIKLPQDIKNNILKDKSPETTSVDETPVLAKGTPSFSGVLPKGKTIANYGGWTRISPEDTEPVYAYSDSIDGININVSQQSLPENFKDGPDAQLGILAQDFHATQQLHANDFVAYIGTSVDGPQSVIFIKKDILIMIKSSTIIINSSWINYLNSLE